MDVFVIYTPGEDSLIEFISQISNLHPTIQFTTEWSTR